MKRFAFILFALLIATASLAQVELRPLLPPYWIAGAVADISGATAEGRYVDFYLNDADLAAGSYAQAIISGNRFILNGFTIFPAALLVGQTYKVATERRGDNFGASGTVKISGAGWDEVTGLTLIDGGGIARPAIGPGGGSAVVEPAPNIKLWFGNRLYQTAIIAAGEKFVVSANPKIRADVSIDAPFAVSNRISDYSIVLDPGTASSKTLGLSASNMSAQSFAVGAALKSFSLEYSVGEAEKLGDGSHVLSITARSSGLSGVQSLAVQVASVEVAGGPLHLIGSPLSFPAPFRIHSDKNITIEYTMSADADIELTIFSVEGRIVKKIYASSGTEGGSAGTNKVLWDGVRQDGLRAGAGIYVGSIVSKAENRLLAKFKVAIVE